MTEDGKNTTRVLPLRNARSNMRRKIQRAITTATFLVALLMTLALLPSLAEAGGGKKKKRKKKNGKQETGTRLRLPNVCVCAACTSDVWNSEAGSFTCGQRIDFLASPQGESLRFVEACRFVAGEFPDVCGPCNPDSCSAENGEEEEEAADNPCPFCDACTSDVLNQLAGAFSCGGRINYLLTPEGGSLSNEEACQFVAEEFPDVCGPACHPNLC